MNVNCRITRNALEHYRERALNGRVVVFDTETTGISREDEVIQISAAEYVEGKLTGTFDRYVIPSCPISPGAEEVHHLSLPFLREHGVAPCAALDAFFAFLGSDVLLVAHNIRFDLRMLANSCRKAAYEASPEGVAFCDTLALARRLVPGQEHYRLGFLIDALGLAGSNSHNALDDTLACGALFFDLVARIPARD